ncbi:MAG: hypothetical protein H7258_15620 [Ferruginibacter sp.]|nr:hypothetical protein [Ferruginibacter sp.]
MQKSPSIYNELKELNSPLADIPATNVFTVPEGYFDVLSLDIMQAINEYRIEELNIPALERNVPEGYFDTLADEVLRKIRRSDTAPAMEEEDGFLASVRKINVFTVPENYFEGLATGIVAQVSPKQPARVIAMTNRFSIFKYAVAAGITGIIGLSLFTQFDKKTAAELVAQVTLIPANQDQSELIKNAGEIIRNDSFDKTLEALGDEEIVGYLKNNGEDINAAMVASVTDEKTLPNEDAYFTDEKTLDNFLNEQHIVQISNN